MYFAANTDTSDNNYCLGVIGYVIYTQKMSFPMDTFLFNSGNQSSNSRHIPCRIPSIHIQKFHN